MRQNNKNTNNNERQGSIMQFSVRPLAKGGLFAATALLSATAFAYTAVENTTLEADGIRELAIRTYSGPLSITRSDSGRIEVEVVIDFGTDWDDDEARDALEDGLVFTLERRGSHAELNSWVGNYDEGGNISFFTWGLIDLFRSGKPRPFSHLAVKVPDGIDLQINDYRGDVIIANITGDMELRTGSGPVEITDLDGDLDLQDGSGEILLTGATGNVEIRDGSGNMDIRRVGGRLTIHDGSGNIDVDTVAGDLDIRDGSGNIRVSRLESDGRINDGSGNISVRSITGTLSLTDGSGNIDVSDVGRDVIVHSSGSGGFDVRNVQGQVINDDRGRRNYNGNDNDNYRYRYTDRERDIDIDEDMDIDVDINVD